MASKTTNRELRAALADDRGSLAMKLRAYRPSELAHWLDGASEAEKLLVFEALDTHAAGVFLEEIDSESQRQILKNASPEHLDQVLMHLPPDQSVDILLAISPQRRERILHRLPQDRIAVIQELLEYPADTAGGLMTTDVTSLPSGIQVNEAIRQLHAGRNAETAYEPCVTASNGVLLGVVPLPKLVFAGQNAMVDEIMVPNPITVKTLDDQEVVGRLFAEYDLISVPVVDDENRLVGVITVDDAIKAIEEEVSEDMYRIAGTNERDPLHGSFATKIWLRLPWLILTLFGGLLVCQVVQYFEASIQSVVALASFLPLIPLIGGNVAVQASTIVVRGIAVGSVQRRNPLHIVMRELSAAVVMGMACALAVGNLAYVFYDQRSLAFIIAASVFSAVNVAVLLGTTAPLLFNRLGMDPALAAGPVVTILNDIISIAIYLGLAALLLESPV